MKHIPFLIIVCFISIFSSCGDKNSNTSKTEPSIIPQPKEFTKNKGEFTFNKRTKITISNESQRTVAEQLQEKFAKAAGFALEISSEAVTENFVAFEIDTTLAKEGYRLHSTRKGVNIKASDYAGFIYGLSSLRQLLPPAIESESKVNVDWTIPAVDINDAPRFVWRGFMMDVSRHFFKKEYVLKTIDRLALLKINTLHLHLIDDQGWRIEIKKYPKLTEVGAWRVDRSKEHFNAREPQRDGEKATYGGFYTQEDIKEIVAYATSRGVTVVPEIEMPAHVSSAIASYPEFACFGQKITVPPGGVWPITDIYCAGKESTFKFLEDILVEVMALFPSKYIHVGGDEATKTNWAKCPDCKARLRKEGLKNVEELQSYFIKRMERFISSKGRVLIGWDEILEGGLAPGATVMSWRGVKGGLEASEQGHDVVMTPGTHCYFDHYQGKPDFEPLAIGGYTTLSKVYEFDPIVSTMSEAQAKHVLGGQANLWAEYIPTAEHSEYMIFPRLAALAETVWSPKELRNKEDFFQRILRLEDRFDVMKINYAKSAFDIVEDAITDEETGTVKITLNNEFPNVEIRYTLDNKDINSSILYTEPITINKTTIIRAAAFKEGKVWGNIFEKKIVFHKAIGQKVSYEKKYSDKYAGGEDLGLVNILRGSANFHDGQWQGWESEDMVATIQWNEIQEISKVSVGTLENQGAHIYFPIAVEVWVSEDGEHFHTVGKIERAFQKNGYAVLKDFTIDFEKQKAKAIKVKATNIGNAPLTEDAWMFIDEIVVE